MDEYLEEALKSNKEIDEMLHEQGFRSNVKKVLISKAQGNIYEVMILIQPILRQTTISDIDDALLKLPDSSIGIHQLCLTSLNQQSEPQALLATRALALITATAAPMTTRALCYALGVYDALHDNQYQDLKELNPKYIPLPQRVNECLKGLLTIDSTTEIITIANNDFAKYLQQDTDKFLSLGHSMFVKITLAYLSLQAFSSGPCTSDGLHLRLEEHVLLGYASRHWGFHTRQTLSNLGHGSRSPHLSPDETEVISKVVRLLERRTNLESSLQVLDPGSQGPKLSTISILQVATRHGLSQVVIGLLQKSPLRVLDVDSNGTTALHEAAQAGWGDLVNILLKSDKQTWPFDKQGKSPWYYAAKNRDYDIMSSLQESRAFLDHTPALRIGCKSALVMAIYYGYQDILTMLLDAGESHSSQERSQSDLIPLHQAIRHNRLDLAADLLNRGADIQTRDNLQRNALFEIFGSRPFSTSGATLLLEGGISKEVRDHNGNTILHEAARLGAHEHVELFINRGLELRVFNTEGLTPLHLAAQCGHDNIIDAFLNRVCIDVDLVDQKLGRTSLMYAASAGHVQLCQRLLESGANIEATSHNQETAMMLAMSANREDVRNLLQAKGAIGKALDIPKGKNRRFFRATAAMISKRFLLSAEVLRNPVP